MATNVSSNTFLSTYNDDFRDSDHFHRILFNNGRALQARELTQLQTIIQTELERLSKFVVNEGAIFNNSGTLASGLESFSYTYIKVTSLPTGFDSLVGTELNNGDLHATVKAVIPDSSQNVIMVRMNKGQIGGSSAGVDTTKVKLFSPGDVLSTSLGNITINTDADAVGNGSLVEMPGFDTYAAGHLVTTEPQTLVLDKFSITPTKVVGYKVIQQVITASDNIALYDNSGATPNLTSPGADRLKISLILTTKDAISSGETFYEVYNIVNGVVTNAKTSNKQLGTITGILNARTESIAGDFVERGAGKNVFNLTISEDSENDNFLSVDLSGGVAFIKGNRIERDVDYPFRVRKPNDQNQAINLTEASNEFIGVNYGNYFLGEENNTFGLVKFFDSYGEVPLWDGLRFRGPGQRTGSLTQIGSARIRNIDKYGDGYRVHVFDVDMDSNGAGIRYNLADVRTIGTDSANHSELKEVIGRYDLYDRDQNRLLFPLALDRVNEVSNLTMSVARKIIGTKTGNTVSVGATDTFSDVEQWVYSVDSDGSLHTNLSITAGGAGSSSATITSVPNGAFTLLAYENVTAQRKTKTVTPVPSSGDFRIDSNLSLIDNEFTLTKTDIFKFDKVIDDATKEDITYKFVLDNGQRDNYYGPGKGKLRQGVTAPSSTVNVAYRFFEHSVPSGTAVGYFDAQSYININYNEIPTFQSNTGQSIRLADMIDRRPMKNPTTGNFTGGISRKEPISKNNDTMTAGTVKYWNPRTDVITLAPNGELTYHKGVPSQQPTDPLDIDPASMILHRLYLNPFVLNKNDLRQEAIDNNGYKMKDIRRLENRIDTLERNYTLTQTELSLSAMEVYDPNSPANVRQTEGLSGDAFKNHIQSAIYDDDYRARRFELKRNYCILTSKVFQKTVGLTYDSDLSLNTTIQKGSTVWPAYSEVVSAFSQDKATRIENVNQFETPQHIASSKLIPEADYFTVRRKVDQSYASASNQSLIPSGSEEVTTDQ
tara:strand:- start:712 stop:3702 length:2991 start_codon:yes stop_codon:yes gene_type:complete